MSPSEPNGVQWQREALNALDVERLALIVFDAALPREADWDFGTGSPYSALAWSFFRYVRGLGFNGIQFGPQGLVSREFPSPYDSAAFSRNPLCLALDELPQSETLGSVGPDFASSLVRVARDGASERGLDSLLEAAPLRSEPETTHHRVAFDCQSLVLTELGAQLRERSRCSDTAGLRRAFRRWCADNRQWLLADAAFEVLCGLHGVDDFEQFPNEDASIWKSSMSHRVRTGRSLFGYRLTEAGATRLGELFSRCYPQLERFAWVQFLLHEQHQRLAARSKETGLELFGDLQVGYSRRDLWHFASLFLQGYRLGAPPSRTNPAGQPWGYPVIDPALYWEEDGGLGPGLRLIELRAHKSFAEYDRVRIDHPHGLVCPWVYATGSGDDGLAVRSGARLFSSPKLRDHPALAKYSNVALEDLNTKLRRHADGWVQELSAEQIRRYACCFDVLVREAGGTEHADRLICEVLSTQPNPLGAVRERYGLGRFRVIQKANVDDPQDVYASANATDRDWVMVGNHDTPTIWQLLDSWRADGQVERQVNYLAARLGRDDAHRARLVERFRSDPGQLAHAKFADLFLSRAKNVLISFGDLLGFDKPYNLPGTISESNWSQRIVGDFAGQHRARIRAGRALDLACALELALQKVAPGSPLLRRGG